MDTCLKECDTIHPDLELTVLDSTEAEAAENAEDEVKELHNSLKEIVHDQDVQPKLQCIMMDPSFSMVTVQGEESSIVWETPAAEVSGRSECSTPWILEAGITPEGYSVEGSGLSGHITIEMDEGKIRRGKGTSSGIKASERSGRDTSKTARVPSEAERPAMVEVSVPNIVQENTSDITVDSNEVKEQQLFSIVSEGYEILNIVVPSKLLTVDEEESNQMNDNLFYLEDSPMIKLKEIPEEPDPIRSSFEMNILHEAQLLKDEQCSKQDEVPQLHSQPLKPDPSRFSQSLNGRPTKTDGTLGADYFEKFTLMDEYSPVDYLSDTEDQVSSKRSQGKETIQTQKNVLDVPIGPEGQDNLASITDVEIPSEHIDEIFYGCSYNDEDENVAREELDEEEVEQPKLAFKASGSALFDSEEPTLSPIFLSPGPPKIIDPILLEEPPAMSFLYSDLYADAVGSRKTEDDAIEEVESIASSPLSFEGWLSDIEDVNGYLEKFILIDETPVLERDNGLRVQSQNPLEFLSALTPVQEEVEEKVTKADNDKLCELISVLQGKSENTEEFASALDLAYHSVEEYCKRNAQSLEKLNGEVAKKVKHLYEEMSQCMGENKRFKLELIRCRIGTIKKSMESAREALEMTLRMMEESVSSELFSLVFLPFVCAAVILAHELNCAFSPNINM
ncbi:cardiomyopathy-associated protein 5 [Arapaima gigas]